MLPDVRGFSGAVAGSLSLPLQNSLLARPWHAKKILQSEAIYIARTGPYATEKPADMERAGTDVLQGKPDMG